MGSQFVFFPSTGEQPLGSSLSVRGYFPVKRKRVCTWVRSIGLRGSSASVTTVAKLGDLIFELGLVTEWVAASLLAACVGHRQPRFC
jgi:hypothetical protein